VAVSEWFIKTTLAGWVLGAGFISVCLKTRWLGPKRGFNVPECFCKLNEKKISWMRLQ